MQARFIEIHHVFAKNIFLTQYYIFFRIIKSRKLRKAGHIVRIKESSDAFDILTDKPTGKRPLGKPRRIWENNI